MAERPGRQRLLRRFFERGPLAARTHRTYTSELSTRRLAAISKNQSPVRRRRFAGNGGCGIADPSCAGLSFRAAAEDGQGRAARRASGDFLAYSLAKCGGFRNLPLAAGVGR